MSGDSFDFPDLLGEEGRCYWKLVGRAAAKHPTMHKIAPHNSYPIQNVNSGEVEKPWIER